MREMPTTPASRGGEELMMASALRYYFLGFYAVSLFVFLVKVRPASLRVPGVDQWAHGLARVLPPLLVLSNFVLPPIIILTRVGELDLRWVPVRAQGLLLSLYAALASKFGAAYGSYAARTGRLVPRFNQRSA